MFALTHLATMFTEADMRARQKTARGDEMRRRRGTRMRHLATRTPLRDNLN